MVERVNRGSHCFACKVYAILGVMGVLFGSPSAQAQTPPQPVTVAITAPPAGQQISGGQATITIAWSSNNPPATIDLTTLVVTVNGVDWTSKFLPSAGQTGASYTNGAPDSFVAGTAASCNNACALNVQVSVSDTAGGTGSASQTDDIVPVFQALSPSAGVAGNTLAAMGAALDPFPGNNSLVFTSFTNPAGLSVPFSTVNLATVQGTATVPVGVAPGPVSLVVNHGTAQQTFPFSVLPDRVTCDAQAPFVAMADGTILGLVRSGEAANNVQCQNFSVSLPGATAVRYRQGGALNGILDIVQFSSSTEHVTGIAVDKTGLNAAVRTHSPADGVVRFYSYAMPNGPNTSLVLKTTTSVPNIDGVVLTGSDEITGDLDFDRAGNLDFLFVSPQGTEAIGQVAKKDILGGTQGASATTIADTQQFLPSGTCKTGWQLAVSCGGDAYIPGGAGCYGNAGSSVVRVDLTNGQVAGVIDQSTVDPAGLGGFVALSCRNKEIWGTNPAQLAPGEFSLQGPVWVSENGGAPKTVVPPGVVYGDEGGLSVAPNGDMYTATYAYPQGFGYIRVPSLVPSCTTSIPPCANPFQPFCPPQQLITVQFANTQPSTTRWAPLRDVEGGITAMNLAFTGSGTATGIDLTTVGVQVLVAPAANTNVTNYVALTGPVTKLSGGGYSVVWNGPWTYTDKSGTHSLPAGDYQVSLSAGLPDGTPIVSNAVKMSLVEVTSVSWGPAAQLGPNPPVFGVNGDPAYRTRPAVGEAIFAEATQPTTNPKRPPPVADTVVLVANTYPIIEAGQWNPVAVYFRALDVADPMGPNVSSPGAAPPPNPPFAGMLFQDNRGTPTNTPVTNPATTALEGLLLAPDGKTWNPGRVPTLQSVSPSSAQGEAFTALQVSREPGDNYRVAASTSQTWLLGLIAQQNSIDYTQAPDKQLASNPVGQVTDSGTNSLVDAVSGQPLTFGGSSQISDMLTVWRTLHLEVDWLTSVAPQTDQALLDLRGTFTTLLKTELEDSTNPFYTAPPLSTLHANHDGWVGANLSLEFHTDPINGWGALDLSQPFPYANRFDVASNNQTDLHINIRPAQLDLFGGLTSAQVKKLTPTHYILRDDEITSLNPQYLCGVASCVADPSLAFSLFQEAYINLQELSHGDGYAGVPLQIFPGSTLDSRNMGADMRTALPPASIPSSSTYWSVGLVSAFEGDVWEDGDPRPNDAWTGPASDPKPNGKRNLVDGYLVGVTGVRKVAGAGFKLQAAVFLETIRDLYEKPPATVPLPPPPGQPQPIPPVTVPLDLTPDVIVRNTAHELLHTMGLSHNGGIMCGSNLQNDPRGALLTDAQLQTLRGAEGPHTAPDLPACYDLPH